MPLRVVFRCEWPFFETIYCCVMVPILPFYSYPSFFLTPLFFYFLSFARSERCISVLYGCTALPFWPKRPCFDFFKACCTWLIILFSSLLFVCATGVLGLFIAMGLLSLGLLTVPNTLDCVLGVFSCCYLCACGGCAKMFYKLYCELEAVR